MSEKIIHRTLFVAVIIKAIVGFFEIGLGVLVILTGKAFSLISNLNHKELLEDPTDFIATHIQGILSHISISTEYFVGIYLLSHGIIKIILSIILLKRKIRLYPYVAVILIIFVAYEAVRFNATHSIILLSLLIYDILLTYLIFHEYRKHSKDTEISTNLDF